MSSRLFPTPPEGKGTRFSLQRSQTGVDVVLVWFDDKHIATIAPPGTGRDHMAAITVNSNHIQNLPGKLHLYVGPDDVACLFIDFQPFADEPPANLPRTN